MEKGKIYMSGGREVRGVPDFVMELFFDKKYSECLSSCEKILEEDPKNELALFYIGSVYCEFKEYKQAIAYLYRFTLLVPEFYPAWRVKGRCESRLKKYEEAKNSFLELVRRNGKSGISWGYAAFMYHALGKSEAALYFLDQSREFVTEHQDGVDYVRSQILEDVDLDAAILYLHELEMAEKDETKKQEYAGRIYNLVLKNTDPLKRSGFS